MKTNRPLGTKAREAAQATAAANRRPTVGGGSPTDAQAYRGATADASVTDLHRDYVEMNLRVEYEKDISAATRAAVYARSGGMCEAPVSDRCTGQGVSLHHRKLRRHGDHSEANLIHLCAFCHHDTHANPARSYLNGWLLRMTDEPDKIPWTRR